MSLFELEPLASKTPVKLSAGARRTLRHKDLLTAGCHPATMVALAGNAKTCRDCAHHHVVDWGRARHWHKCDVSKLGKSHSEASDIRVSWPACVQFVQQGEAHE